MKTYKTQKKKYAFDKEAITIPSKPLNAGDEESQEAMIKQMASVYSRVKFTLYSISGYTMKCYILEKREEIDDFIMLVEKGRIRVKVNQQECIIEKPAIVFTHKGDLLSWENLDDQPAEIYGIHGILSDGEGISILANLDCTFFDLGKDQHLRQGVQQLYQFYTHDMDLARLSCADWIRQLLISMIIRGHRINFDHWAVSDEVLRKAISLIQNQNKIIYNVNDLAQKLNISRTQLNRKFNKHLKQSVMDYINHHRLGTARKLLLGSNRLIQEISEELGYSSENYFYANFKKFYGLTPKKFRDHYSPP